MSIAHASRMHAALCQGAKKELRRLAKSAGDSLCAGSLKSRSSAAIADEGRQMRTKIWGPGWMCGEDAIAKYRLVLSCSTVVVAADSRARVIKGGSGQNGLLDGIMEPCVRRPACSCSLYEP